jgi:hypothetical protein
MARASLRNRIYGYEFSGLEHNLLFGKSDVAVKNNNVAPQKDQMAFAKKYELSELEHNLLFGEYNTYLENDDAVPIKDHMGFVKRIQNLPNTFQLNPSPFYNRDTNHYYVFVKPPFPDEKSIVKANVNETEKIVDGYPPDVSYIFLHYVTSWTEVDPKKLTSRQMLDKEEFIGYFTEGIKGDISVIETIGNVLSICAVSSPQYLDSECGGMSTAIFGKKENWITYKRKFSVIPKELLSPKSNVRYQFIDKPINIPTENKTEINIAVQNPENIPIQIPVQITSKRNDVELMPLNTYIEDMDYLSPMVTGRILDSLMFQPKITKTLEKTIDNAVYDLINELRSSTGISYNQDIGSVVPKLSTAIARTNLTEKMNKEEIRTSVDTWTDMFHYTKTDNIKDQKERKLSPDAQHLHGEMLNSFAKDTKISIDDIRTNTKFNEQRFMDALRELHQRGLVIMYSGNRVHIME